MYSEVIYTAFENANIAYFFQNSSSQLFPYLFVQVGSSQIIVFLVEKNIFGSCSRKLFILRAFKLMPDRISITVQ